MRLIMMRTTRRVSIAAALMASAALVAAGAASAAVPGYSCGVPTVYNVDTPGDIGGIAAGNLNGHGLAGVATANLAGTSSVFLSNSNGILAPAVNYPLANPIANADSAGYPILVDLTGNGILDLVTANYYGQNISVMLGKGNGTFGPATTIALGRNPRYVFAGHFSRDGKVDLVAFTTTASSTEPAAELLLGKGNGSFHRPRTIPLPSTAGEMVVGDFNRDGFSDLATANGDNSVSVLLNNGHGKFGAPISYPVGSGPFGIAIGDFNGDGFPDLVTANLTDNTFSVLLNKGDGTGHFNPAVSYPGGGGQMDTIVADMNGDGHPDIVAANPYNNNIMVLLNQGNGTFGAPIICPNAPADATNVRGPLHLAAADLNHDGKLDIVTANLHFGNNGPTISTLISRR